jgi:hypothetical protein
MTALLTGLWESRGNLSRMKFGWQRSRIKRRRPLMFHQLVTRRIRSRLTGLPEDGAWEFKGWGL